MHKYLVCALQGTSFPICEASASLFGQFLQIALEGPRKWAKMGPSGGMLNICDGPAEVY